MKFLFDAADRYIKTCDWKDLALLKFCLFAMGLFIGAQVPKEEKKPVQAVGLAIFAATYVPLMAKFFAVLSQKQTPEA
ncbi:MAG: permease of phosphate ABC transporter [Faecousia sp.]